MHYIQPPIKQFFKPSNVSIQQNESLFALQESTTTSKTSSYSQKCVWQSANSAKNTNSPTVEDLGVDSDSNYHDVPRPEPNNVFFPLNISLQNTKRVKVPSSTLKMTMVISFGLIRKF